MTRGAVIRWASYLLVVASFVFIGITLYRMDFGIIWKRVGPLWALCVIGASVFYSLANFILAANWCVGLRLITGRKLERYREIVLIYFKTGIAKYLPSNLVHFASRHYLVTRFNFSHRVMLLGNIFEIAYLCVTAFLIVGAGVASGLLVIPPKIYSFFSPWRILAIAGVLAAGVVAAIWYFGPAKIREYMAALVRVRKLPVYVLLLAGYAVYFAVTALIVAFIFGVFLGIDNVAGNLPFILVGYTLAWVTGYLVPGAPGGLGIREVVLLLVFSGQYGEANVMAAAVILRIITVLGDVVTFLYGMRYRVEDRTAGRDQ